MPSMPYKCLPYPHLIVHQMALIRSYKHRGLFLALLREIYMYSFFISNAHMKII